MTNIINNVPAKAGYSNSVPINNAINGHGTGMSNMLMLLPRVIVNRYSNTIHPSKTACCFSLPLTAHRYFCSMSRSVSMCVINRMPLFNKSSVKIHLNNGLALFTAFTCHYIVIPFKAVLFPRFYFEAVK